MLENLVVHTLVFDDNEKSMGTIYSRLSKLGVLDLGGNNDDGGDDDYEFAFGENNSDLVFKNQATYQGGGIVSTGSQ